MKLSPQWIRDFVELWVDDRRLAVDLTAAGIAVEAMSGSGENTVFEMEIGTNRADAMNHYGVAREASAIYDLPLKPLQPKLPAASSKGDFAIEVAEPDLCPRFTARVLRGVRIKPSPEKVAHRLGLLDQRPINNAVDATNYTLWEMGKPTHAFDLDLLEGEKIIVRRAHEGETLKTLDGVERKLTQEDLVVADARKPVALAGVMGGFDTMITQKTRNVVIESAWWDPVTIRKSSRRHGLHTDASHRFERGADFESTAVSCDRVAELILESGGGELAGGVIDVVAKRVDLAPVALHISEVHRILGASLEAREIYRSLRKLGFDVMPERGGDADFTVRIPSWRLDVEREIDLIEEIARLYGYDKFANTLPAFAGAVIERPDAEKDAKLRSFLLGLGYNEAVSLTFISHEDAEAFSDSPVVELANPRRSARAIMDGICVAQLGQVHPEVAAKRKLRQEVYLGEIYLDRLYKHPLRAARYEALPRYPAVERDFSFLFPDSVVFEKIQQAVGALGLRELRSFVPVEIFRGGKVPVGKYSILLRATFQSGERTLREDEVADWSGQIVKALESLGGGQRT